MIFGCGENIVHLVSQFGWASFFRLLLNIALPGIETLTYLKKFGFDLGIILTSIVQFSEENFSLLLLI